MILVFKTSVSTKRAISEIKATLDNLFENGKWNFDLADCDKILRIDTSKNVSKKVVAQLKRHGFDCEELE